MDERQFHRCYCYGPYRKQIAKCVNRKTKHYETRQDITADIWARISGCSDTSTGTISRAIVREKDASYMRIYRAWRKELDLVELANQFARPLIMSDGEDDEQDS